MDENKKPTIDQEASNSRRSFLKKAGKLAIYTPPAMMVLMKPSYAKMNQSYEGGHTKPTPKRGTWRRKIRSRTKRVSNKRRSRWGRRSW